MYIYRVLYIQYYILGAGLNHMLLENPAQPSR